MADTRETKTEWVVLFEVTQPFHGPGGAPGEADVVHSPGDQFPDEASIPVGVITHPVPVQVTKPAAGKAPAGGGKDK